MAAPDDNDDVRAIRILIEAHFQRLQWTPGTRADWPAFAADFLPDASLFPAARPVRRQSVDAFIARMDGPVRDKLHSFEETMLRMEILVFGTVAVVLGASEMLENGTEVNRDVSGFLLVKDQGKWSIAAHAWDHETPAMPVPEHLRHA